MRPVYVTTDTHFNHKALWKEFNIRPKYFETKILQSHYNIPEDAILIHLGDFCIGRDKEAHRVWNKATGHIRTRILVKGNHDKRTDSWYYRHHWDLVVDNLAMALFGKRMLFSHVPVPREDTSRDFSDVNIHGHTHASLHRDKEVRDYYDENYHLEIALENTDYQPVKISKKLLRKYE